jgi:imidazolonepropionase-like amidohydrolase
LTGVADEGAARTLHLHGVVLPDDVERDVFVVDGTFVFDLPPGVPDSPPLVRGAFMLPGLVDVHAHLALNSPAPDGSPAHVVARASAMAQLGAGVLALREPASPTVPSTGIGPESGLPRTVTAGRFLTAPERYFPGAAIEVRPDELAGSALEQLADGGGWVKVIGDWVDPADGVWRPTFPTSVLAAAAEAVHRAGGRIAVHAADHEAVESAIDAGVDSIEHGLDASNDQVERMARAGIALTPTLTAVMGFWVELVEMVGSPTSEVERAARMVERHPGVVRAADGTGVRLLAGTDSGVVPHGAIAGEVRRMVDAGVDPSRAVAAASWDARDYLGWPGIVAGAPADVVTFEADPRRDPEVLARPGAIVLAGRVVKPPADTMEA